MSTNARRILVVDDNRSIHDDFAKIFHGFTRGNDALDAAAAELFGEEVQSKGATYDLEFASQGQEGFEMVRTALAKRQPYSMAFVDVQMPPGWDGVETISRIWEIAPELQVVLCTAYSNYALDEIIKRVGCSDRFVVLKKPFETIEVMQLANSFSEKTQLLVELNERARKLEESQRRYRFLAEAMPAMLWTADANGNLDYLNQRWYDYTRMTEGASKDWGWQTIVHPDDLPRCLQRWTAALTTGQNYEVEIRLRRADATYRWHLCRAMPMRNHNGDIIHWVGTCTDIDDKKRAENELLHAYEGMEKRVAERTAELTRSERLLRTVLDVLPQRRIFWKDRQGRYLGANNQFLRDCGLTDVVGKTDDDLPWSEEEKKALLTVDREVMETGEATLDMIVSRTNADGKTIWRSTSKVPLCDSSGAIIGVLGTYLDITERKLAEKERQMMELQLRQAQKMEAIGQLAAGIAHEINTPTQYVGDNTRFLQDAFGNIMPALKLCIELVEAAKKNVVAPEMITRMEEALKAADLDYHFEQVPTAITETLEGVDRVTKIVRAMKEFSHPGGRAKSAADLNKAIDSTVTVARNEWKYVADIALELDPNLPLVPCFVGEFNQAILNLVVNASHAISDVVRANGGKKGKITIQTRRDGETVEVRVSDTGTGIAEEHRARIFEPFFTTKDVGKGTGQGLSVVYGSIVKRHGGTVNFETELGKGTTFILRLPLVSKAVEAAEAGADPAPASETVGAA